MLINCTCHVRLCVYMGVGTGFIHAFIKLMLLRFLCIVIETLCTGSRRSSRWGLCRRWLHRGLSLWQSPVRPVRHCRLIRTGEHRAPVVVIFKTSYPVCMLGILLWFYWTHAFIYVYMYPDGFERNVMISVIQKYCAIAYFIYYLHELCQKWWIKYVQSVKIYERYVCLLLIIYIVTRGFICHLRSQFCSCRDNWAVMVFSKFRPGLIIVFH